jgi:hypothetical protein
MSIGLKYFFSALLLLFIQYVLCNMTPLGGFITPYIYFIFILWLPFKISRNWLLIIAALYGLIFGFLVVAPGIHAACCVLVAYLRPFIISILLPREVKEMNFAEPSFKSMGLVPYGVYVMVLTFIHHAYLVFLQLLSVGNFFYFLKKLIFSTIVSLLLIAIAEAFAGRKQKTRASLN